MKKKYSEFSVRLVYCRRDQRFQHWTPVEIVPSVYSSLIKQVDCYWSIARFKKDALHASEGDLLDLEYVLPLLFDVDCHDHKITLHQVCQQTWLLFNWIKRRLYLRDHQIFTWMSGAGFHIAVPAEIAMDNPVTNSFHRERDYQKIAILAAREIPLEIPVKIKTEAGFQLIQKKTLDLSIYGFKRLIRVPGSRHSRPRLKAVDRKIALTSKHLEVLASKANAKDFNKSLSLLAEQPFVSPGEWI